MRFFLLSPEVLARSHDMWGLGITSPRGADVSPESAHCLAKGAYTFGHDALRTRYANHSGERSF
ncbi:hypothetical protein CHELA20_52718 [Hyphomicrobiales bacterium]|nr:hypothetical protein CHELA41_22208 [Hyphomicrobiales bacterium]CAH1682712.1 hypothetical protein CHELA20_52718 [Hyphomicrobiales bacterium]